MSEPAAGRALRCYGHDIVGKDYGECRRCGALFFRTSGGLWQAYDDGRRIIPRDEDGWLIERANSTASEPKYWCAGMLDPQTYSAWTSNHMQAIRFARKLDAERVAERIMKGIEVRVCEHIWQRPGEDDSTP